MNTAIHAFLILLIAMSFTACDTFSNSAKPQGTGDSGGGNTYRGKPLESYKKETTSLEGYKSIAPIMATLKTKHPQLYNIFSYVLKRKSWYFVPGPLANLPNEKTGSMVPTEQVALQDFDGIWIDTDIFDSMSNEDQGVLILHEVLMGIKILRFESYYGSCMVNTPDVALCDSAWKQKMGSPKDLTPTDYSQIRYTVTEILNHYKEKEYADWEELFGSQEFDFGGTSFRTKDSERKLSNEELQEWLSKSKALGFIPRFGFTIEELLNQHPELRQGPAMSPIDWQSHESCNFEIEILPNDILHLYGSKGQKSFDTRYPLYPDSLAQRRTEFTEKVWSVNLLMHAFPNAKIGDRVTTVHLHFSWVGQLKTIELGELACANEDCSGWSTPQGAETYYCSTKPNLRYK